MVVVQVHHRKDLVDPLQARQEVFRSDNVRTLCSHPDASYADVHARTFSAVSSSGGSLTISPVMS